MAIRYQERRFWSVMLGCNAARISIPDENYDEHYAIVPMDGTGKENRRRRTLVLEQIASHVQRKLPPGEVDIDLSQPTESV